MGHSKQTYAAEANRCRQEASHYEGKPEQPFLLRLAKEFEGLARPHVSPRSRQPKA